MLGTLKALLITFKWLLILYIAAIVAFLLVLAGLGVGVAFLALVLPIAIVIAATFLVTRLLHTG